MLTDNYDRLKNTELFILDMDGTIYLGDKVFEDAVDFISKAKACSIKIV